MSLLTKSVAVAVLALCVYGLRQHMRGGRYTGDARIDGKLVIITGANTGIGKTTALELAKRGGRIVMACRDMQRCAAAREDLIKQQAPGERLECQKINLASFASIRQFAKEIKAKHDRIDILINNAGVMMTPYLLTEDGLEMQIGVNHFGHFLLTQLLLDSVKSAAPSRIIFVSSRAHLRGTINFEEINSSEQNYSSIQAYGQSKLANVLCARELARRLAGSGVTVNSLHPGAVATELPRHFSAFNSTYFQYIFAPFAYTLLKTPEEGMQTTLRLAVDPSLDGVTGKYFSDCVEKETNPEALDDDVAQRLWELSERITSPS